MSLSVYDDSGLIDLSNFSINYSLSNRIKLRERDRCCDGRIIALKF